MNASKAGDDLALIQTSLLSSFIANKLAFKQLDFHIKIGDVGIKTRSLAASVPFIGQTAELATVKSSVFPPDMMHLP